MRSTKWSRTPLMCARPNGVSRHNHWFVFESALAAYTSYWKKTWMGPRTPKSFSCQVFRGIGLGGEDQVGGLRGSQPILFQPWTGRHKFQFVCFRDPNLHSVWGVPKSLGPRSRKHREIKGTSQTHLSKINCRHLPLGYFISQGSVTNGWNLQPMA